MPNKIPANNMAILTGRNKTFTGKCTASIEPKPGTTTTFLLSVTLTDLEFNLELNSGFTFDDNNDTGSEMNPHNGDLTKIYGAFSNNAKTTIIQPNTPVTGSFQMAVQTGVDIVHLNLRITDTQTNGVKVRSGE